MVAQIKLKNLTGINAGNKKVVTNVSNTNTETLIDSIGTDKLVFVGYDYKGTLDNLAASGKGMLELCLERADNCFRIEGVKTGSTGHSYDGKIATIGITVTNPKITEKDAGWFITELDLAGFTETGSSLKFGEWNDFSLPDNHHVDVTFS